MILKKRQMEEGSEETGRKEERHWKEVRKEESDWIPIV